MTPSMWLPPMCLSCFRVQATCFSNCCGCGAHQVKALFSALPWHCDDDKRLFSGSLVARMCVAAAVTVT